MEIIVREGLEVNLCRDCLYSILRTFYTDQQGLLASRTEYDDT